MKDARLLGSYVQQILADRSMNESDLANKLSCQESDIRAFLKGRTFLSFSQLDKISAILGVPVLALLKGDEDAYNRTFVHCMTDFSDISNREKILDIIDDYLDIVETVE